MITGIAAISFVLLAGYISLFLFYYAGWRKTIPFVAEKFSAKTKVSVIVAVRNEERNIMKCLDSLLSQDYPEDLFEVVVVDDHSEDSTLAILKSYGSPNLKIIELKNFPLKGASFKKLALEKGIEQAAGDLMVTTDGDCEMGRNWLSTIVSFYEKHQPKIIAGPVALKQENGWLQKWQSLDLTGMMGITAGAITNGFPNMCNGANLAYEKKVFNEVGGFGGIDRIPTGDDILLLLKIKEKFPSGIKFLRAKEAIVYTHPQHSFQELVSQRLRWISKSGDFQDRKITRVLLLTYAFNLSVVINFLEGLFFRQQLLWMFFILLAAKMIIEFPLFWEVSGFFAKRKLLLFYLPAEIIHVLYINSIGIASKFFSYNWKGRVVKPNVRSEGVQPEGVIQP